MAIEPETNDNPLVQTTILVFREGRWEKTSAVLPASIIEKLRGGSVIPIADEDSEEVFIKMPSKK